MSSNKSRSAFGSIFLPHSTKSFLCPNSQIHKNAEFNSTGIRCHHINDRILVKICNDIIIQQIIIFCRITNVEKIISVFCIRLQAKSIDFIRVNNNLCIIHYTTFRGFVNSFFRGRDSIRRNRRRTNRLFGNLYLRAALAFKLWLFSPLYIFRIPLVKVLACANKRAAKALAVNCAVLPYIYNCKMPTY